LLGIAKKISSDQHLPQPEPVRNLHRPEWSVHTMHGNKKTEALFF
jgi:hypothetical protein